MYDKLDDKISERDETRSIDENRWDMRSEDVRIGESRRDEKRNRETRKN